MTHYVVYLDKFGHVGQYVSRHHPRYKTHPAFGFAGLILPATESHLFQTIQCADWICGLIGRLTALLVAPDEYPELEPFDKYFSDRIAKVTMPSSGLEHQKTAEVPAERAGEIGRAHV